MTENDDDLYYHSELETAVIQNDGERFEALAEEANLHGRSDNGSTLLHKAASVGETEMVQRLIDRGIDTDIQNEGGKTALHVAVDNGHTEAGESLVTNGAALNIQDNSGAVPLFKLVYRNDVELAQLMVENGADPTIESNGGVSPLDIATEIDADDMVEILRQNPS